MTNTASIDLDPDRDTALPGPPQEPGSPLSEYVRLTRQKRELETRLEQLRRELAQAEDRVHDHFRRNGVNLVHDQDGATLYLHRELLASLTPDADGTGEYKEACQALRAHGGGHLVQETVNRQNLRSWVRQQEQRGEPLPAPLAPLLRIKETYRIRVRL